MRAQRGSVMGGGAGASASPRWAVIVWASVYFGRLMWNTAVNRGVSGWLGVLVFVPLVGFFAYLYIAFHDGVQGPSKLGLALGVILYVLPTVPMMRSGSEIGQLATLGAQMGSGDQAAALEALAQMSGDESLAAADLERMMQQLGQASESRTQGERSLPAGFDEEEGFAVDDAFVAALCGEFPCGLERVLMLQQAKQQVGAGERQADAGRSRLVGLETEDQRDKQRQRKHRIDDGNDAPRNSFVAEGPQQMSPVAGAGVEQATGAIA